ncbi:hypothetical protein [Coleofasciculus sp. E1-EBD-02]|uniref:hypothetical protein n=1 Tax=Coleofasciculus sp. E1-EBD-02 TaxID=3068481 RepID=UPI0032F2E747
MDTTFRLLLLLSNYHDFCSQLQDLSPDSLLEYAVIKIQYGGYISATRHGVSFSEPCFVICDSPLKVLSELKSECIHRFPHAEGFINHSTSSFDEVVIYGVVEED